MMANDELIKVAEECAKGALSNKMSFPEVLQKLSAIGVERYHADYSREEITYYLADGDSHVTVLSHPKCETGKEFASDLVAAAVQQSQRGEHTYLDFIRKTMEAGCVGYFVQIAGRRVIYFGRNGDTHVEYFPT